MRPIFPRLSLRPRFGRACVLLAAVGLLGACDRHSADEVPPSYGHGSSHANSFDTHSLDAHRGSKSFSDSVGTEAEGPGEHEGAEHKAEPAGSPGEAQPGRFFPKGS